MLTVCLVVENGLILQTQLKNELSRQNFGPEFACKKVAYLHRHVLHTLNSALLARGYTAALNLFCNDFEFKSDLNLVDLTRDPEELFGDCVAIPNYENLKKFQFQDSSSIDNINYPVFITTDFQCSSEAQFQAVKEMTPGDIEPIIIYLQIRNPEANAGHLASNLIAVKDLEDVERLPESLAEKLPKPVDYELDVDGFTMRFTTQPPVYDLAISNSNSADMTIKLKFDSMISSKDCCAYQTRNLYVLNKSPCQEMSPESMKMSSFNMVLDLLSHIRSESDLVACFTAKKSQEPYFVAWIGDSCILKQSCEKKLHAEHFAEDQPVYLINYSDQLPQWIDRGQIKQDISKLLRLFKKSLDKPEPFMKEVHAMKRRFQLYNLPHVPKDLMNYLQNEIRSSANKERYQLVASEAYSILQQDF